VTLKHVKECWEGGDQSAGGGEDPRSRGATAQAEESRSVGAFNYESYLHSSNNQLERVQHLTAGHKPSGRLV
jgi:hypothetical protein